MASSDTATLALRTSAQDVRPSALVVDDETTLLHILSTLLTEHGYDVETAASAEEALTKLEQLRPAVALFDIVLPRRSGLDLLAELKRKSSTTEVVIMTSHASLTTALEAIRLGAYDYLQKPFDDLDHVVRTLDRALERQALAGDNRRLLEEQERRNTELTATVARLSSLLDASQALGELRSLPELLDRFIELVARELRVARASVMLLDPESHELRIAASRGIGGFDVEAVRVRLGQTIAGSVAQSKRPVLVADTTRSMTAGRLGNPDLANSFLSVPIVLGEVANPLSEVLGVINVTNRDSGAAFDEGDLAFLAGLAGQLAVAIDGSRRFDELRIAYEALKIAQEQLLLSERKKAVASMAAGVAHDFNNALAVMLGRVELVLGRLRGDAPVAPSALRKDLEIMRKSALQAAERVQRLQHLTRPIERADEPVALDAVIRDAVEMTRPKWRFGGAATGGAIDVRLELEAVPPILGSRHELGQLATNLIFNAVEAMPRGGLLTLRSSLGDGTVRMEVEDTGIGMSPETRKRLFDPFFTTKPQGQGLGTAIVQAIARRHGATIEVESEEGQGSRFAIVFPFRETAEPQAARSEPPRRAENVRALSVLIVDDDEVVLETHAAIVASAGHVVETALGGRDALSRLARSRFDVLMTDLSMPGMSGVELAATTKRDYPTLPVVLLTGWAGEAARENVEGIIDRVLTKPCQSASLLEAIAEVAAPER